jgi:hypothetical protein
MKFQSIDKFSISEEALSQEVNGETVLPDLEGESYFGLNEVGTLSDEYDASWKQLESDVGDLLVKRLFGTAHIVYNYPT